MSIMYLRCLCYQILTLYLFLPSSLSFSPQEHYCDGDGSRFAIKYSRFIPSFLSHFKNTIVTEVDPGSAAQQAGLLIGMRIYEVNGVTIVTDRDIMTGVQVRYRVTFSYLSCTRTNTLVCPTLTHAPSTHVHSYMRMCLFYTYTHTRSRSLISSRIYFNRTGGSRVQTNAHCAD
jgi:hypothetical protein